MRLNTLQLASLVFKATDFEDNKIIVKNLCTSFKVPVVLLKILILFKKV